jgi:predicted helicase
VSICFFASLDPGKTFTSLKVAEAIAGKGGRVLFLVPSLSLLSQTLTEWTQESAIPLHSFAVCSDSDVGKKRKKEDDAVQTFTHELRYPATTAPERLAAEMAKRHDGQHMSVVFSTYHSIDVISQAQHDHNLADFDLIVCDEAHRTTGVTFADDDESAFVRVHDADYIRAAKRLYMTATPRIYADSAKATADRDGVELCSMDDEALYGKQLYLITFSDAVERQLLVDYKVIVLAVEESHVSRRLQKLLASEDNQLKVDDCRAPETGPDCWLHRENGRPDPSRYRQPRAALRGQIHASALPRRRTNRHKKFLPHQIHFHLERLSKALQIVATATLELLSFGELGVGFQLRN